MVTKPRTRRRAIPDKETLLTAARTAIRAAGGKPISMRQFSLATGLKYRHVYTPLPHLERTPPRRRASDIAPFAARIDDDLLLADYGTVARQLQRIPTADDYHRHGKYGATTICRRFRGWLPIRRAFHALRHPPRALERPPPLLHPHHPWRTRHPPQSHALPRLPAPCSLRLPFVPASASAYRAQTPSQTDAPSAAPTSASPACATPPSMKWASSPSSPSSPSTSASRSKPSSPASPTAKPPVTFTAGAWQTVRIEFEYESRTFHKTRPPARRLRHHRLLGA